MSNAGHDGYVGIQMIHGGWKQKKQKEGLIIIYLDGPYNSKPVSPSCDM